MLVGNRGMMCRDNMGSMLQVDSLHRLTGGLGDLVVNVGALDFGDNVTVLNLHWYKLHLRVVNTMLSGNLATCVLHFRGDRVSNSMGNWERCHRGSNHWSNRSMSNNRGRHMSNRSRYMSNRSRYMSNRSRNMMRSNSRYGSKRISNNWGLINNST